jgi:hypothetical protein
MNAATRSESKLLTVRTSSFVLAAAVAVVFNTLLAWVKDAYEPLNAFMKSLTGHHWTTHGLADLLVFFVLAWIFEKTRIAEKLDPNRLISILVAAVVLAAVGLGLWFVLF